MSNLASAPHAFDAARAAVYDQQFEPIRAIKDALHLLLRVHFAQLPADARILVAGAGTGAEVRFLAPIFPGWRFTLVDPAEAMLAVARRHAEAQGFAARCVFHSGFVSELPQELHHAATSVFVSHFLTNTADRQSYFEQIALRMRPGGLLFNCDLSADRSDTSFERVMDLWVRVLDHTGALPIGAGEAYRGAFGRDFAAHAPAEVAAIISRAGFTAPALCYQAALARAWIAQLR